MIFGFICGGRLIMGKGTNKLRRVRIYKLSTFDTFTDEERALNESYKKANPKDKKTDWFYGTNDYEREFDERADTNQYKL